MTSMGNKSGRERDQDSRAATFDWVAPAASAEAPVLTGAVVRIAHSAFTKIYKTQGHPRGTGVAEQGTDMTQVDGRDRPLMSVRASHSARAALSGLRRVSFGGPAAIVTSIGLVLGLNAATTSRVANR